MRRTRLLTSLLLIACDGAPREPAVQADTAAAAAPAHFTTDSSTYTLRRDGPGWTANIGYAFRNDGDTLYIVNCNDAVVMNLEKRTDAGWRYALGMPTNACLSPPLVIDPGITMRGTLAIWGAEPGNPSYTAFEMPDIEGEYRLSWHQLRRHYRTEHPNFGDTLKVDERVSTPFRLQREGM